MSNIITVNEEQDIWEQKPDESDRDYQYFKLYLDMGASRKIVDMPKVYPELDVNVTRLTKLSGAYQWRLRSQAYDAQLLEERRQRFETRLNDILEHEFDELTEAYNTSHILRKRIENDTSSSTYSMLNAWKNWVEAHGKITDELYVISGKPKTPNKTVQPKQIEAIEQTETKKISDMEKLEEVTKSLRLIKQ